MTPWFDESTAGMVAGALGAGIGVVFGGIGGGVGGPLVALGKAKAFVFGMIYLGIGVGVGLTLTAIAAMVDGQPRWVWYSFLLPGLVCGVVMGGMLPVARYRYREAEQRKIDAQNFRA